MLGVILYLVTVTEQQKDTRRNNLVYLMIDVATHHCEDVKEVGTLSS